MSNPNEKDLNMDHQVVTESEMTENVEQENYATVGPQVGPPAGPQVGPPRMNMANTLLLLVALVQAALVGYMFWNQNRTVTVSTAPLIAEELSLDDVHTISMSDADGEVVNLAQQNGEWVLPDAGEYPVTASNVTNLFSKLQDIDSRTVIASNKASYKRLQVADDDFVRKIDLDFADGKKQSFYLGSSPSASSIHVRSSTSDSVYLSNDINSFDVRTNSGNWVDTNYLTLISNEIIELELKNAQGDFSFTRSEDGTWQLAGLPADAELDSSAVDSLINKVSSVRMIRPLGKTAEDSYNVAEPQAEVTITTATELVPESEEATESAEASENGVAEPEVEIERNSYKLIIAANIGDEGYVAKRDASDYYVLLSSFNAEDFVTKGQIDFLVQEDEETSE